MLGDPLDATGLHIAAAKGHVETLDELLKLGVDVNGRA